VKLTCVSVVFLVAATAAAESYSAETDERSAVTVAALPFRLASDQGQYAPLAEAAGDMLMARLSTVEGLKFVERAAIDKVLAERNLAVATRAEDRVRLGQAVGAKFVLVGSLSAAGGELQINAHLLEVATQRIAASADATSAPDRLFEQVDLLAGKLAEGLDVKLPELTPQQIDRSPQCSLHFMRGLGYYYAEMYEHAGTEFLKALAIDPNYAPARFYNGMSYFDQAEYEHARIEFERFVKQFEDHPLAERAGQMLRQCEARLREPRKGDLP